MFMAHCPKCGKKLKVTDISQFCPGCGVNMRFVNFEQDFYREAKIAELSQANMSVKIKHIKAAFVGSKLAVARLIVMLLPIAALLVPNGSFTLAMPFRSGTYGFGILGLLGLLMPDGFNLSGLFYIINMSGGDVDRASFTALRNALFSYLSIAVIGVLILLVSVLCFISYKNMQKINVVLAALGIAACVVSMILISSFASVAKEGTMLTGKNGFGLIVAVLMFATVFVVNLLLSKNGIPIEYDEGMLERQAIYKKVKSGEVDIDSLPQPVVETEATRKIDEEIRKEEEAFKMKHSKEGDNNGN